MTIRRDSAKRPSTVNLEELDFPYPEALVATERQSESRVMWVGADADPVELPGTRAVVDLFEKGDCLVINDTRVMKRRVFTESGLEILFLRAESETTWQVLCPSSRWKAGQKQILPQGVELEIVARGIPQTVRADRPLTDEYFEKVGEMPLPPYIQKARGERHNREADRDAYQTAWAKNDGSLAAPTASLHFSHESLEALRAKGVNVVTLTLHVGLGTFLPINVQNLDEHTMHAEYVEIPEETWAAVDRCEGRVWALGTTVTRSLESAAHGKLARKEGGGFFGETDLFIRPGFEFRAVDCILTNFHQPRSTLLALVAAFAGLERVKKSYSWAIEKGFRLFSYGDLSVWTK